MNLDINILNQVGLQALKYCTLKMVKMMVKMTIKMILNVTLHFFLKKLLHFLQLCSSCLSFLHNHFDDPTTKLFLNLYLAKFSDIFLIFRYFLDSKIVLLV